MSSMSEYERLPAPSAPETHELELADPAAIPDDIAGTPDIAGNPDIAATPDIASTSDTADATDADGTAGAADAHDAHLADVTDLAGATNLAGATDAEGATDVTIAPDLREPVDTAQPTPSSRRRGLLVLGCTAVVVAVAAVVGAIAWDRVAAEERTISPPSRIAGLTLDNSQGAHETIEYLRAAIQTGVSLRKSTGAVYADEAGQSRSVLFVGGTGDLPAPADALGKTFNLIADDNGGVESVHAVSAGRLGGMMRCGSTKTDGGSMAVCGWADKTSLGIAMFPNRPIDESANLLRTMRLSMQKN